MENFETKLVTDILLYLEIEHIIKVCSSLTSRKYQIICKNENLWKK